MMVKTNWDDLFDEDVNTPQITSSVNVNTKPKKVNTFKEKCPYCEKEYSHLDKHLKSCKKNPSNLKDEIGDIVLSIPVEIKGDIIFFIQKVETQYQTQGMSKEMKRRYERLMNFLLGGHG